MEVTDCDGLKEEPSSDINVSNFILKSIAGDV